MKDNIRDGLLVWFVLVGSVVAFAVICGALLALAGIEPTFSNVMGAMLLSSMAAVIGLAIKGGKI